MQDKTITNALLALRKQIIRGDGQGLEHVVALLDAQNVHMPRVLPHRSELVARSGEMRRIILGALCEQPMPLSEIASVIAEKRGEINDRRLRNRTSQCLFKMKLRGMVRREGRVWQPSLKVGEIGNQ